MPFPGRRTGRRRRVRRCSAGTPGPRAPRAGPCRTRCQARPPRPAAPCAPGLSRPGAGCRIPGSSAVPSHRTPRRCAGSRCRRSVSWLRPSRTVIEDAGMHGHLPAAARFRVHLAHPAKPAVPPARVNDLPQGVYVDDGKAPVLLRGHRYHRDRSPVMHEPVPGEELLVHRLPPDAVEPAQREHPCRRVVVRIRRRPGPDHVRVKD